MLQRTSRAFGGAMALALAVSACSSASITSTGAPPSVAASTAGPSTAGSPSASVAPPASAASPSASGSPATPASSAAPPTVAPTLAAPSGAPSSAPSSSPSAESSPSAAASPAASSAPSAAPSSVPSAAPGASSSPSPTPTATIPPGAIVVDSFDQEEPFKTDGNCTFGEAIVAANSHKAVDACPAGPAQGSVIVLRAGTYMLHAEDTRPLTLFGTQIEVDDVNGLPMIGSNLTIDGNGATIVRAANAPKFRDLAVFAGTVTIRDLTLKGGVGGVTEGDNGGGGLEVYSVAAHVTLDDVSVIDNSSITGDSPGGGIYNLGFLTITNSHVDHNVASSWAGGIENSSTLTVTNSTIDDNVAKDTAEADYQGGGLYNDDGDGVSATLEDTQVDGNTASEGGGIYNLAKLTIRDSTIAHNVATENGANSVDPQGGGGIKNGPDEGASTATISGSVIADNTALKTTGGGIYTNEHMSITTTLIEGNRAEVGAGLYAEHDTSSVKVTQSCFIGNGTGIVNGGPTISALDNWWGAAAGPTAGDRVSGSVTYRPVLTSEPATCSSATIP